MDAGRLLLIEDDATTREVLELLLSGDGWTVLPVESGEAALGVLQGAGPHAEQPRVILADLHLEGLQGPDLAAQLQAAAPASTLLAMSASGSPEGAEGYRALLRKPFGPAELREALALVAATSGAGSAGHAEEASGIPGQSSPERESDLPVLATETFLKLEQQMGVRAKELYGFALADAGDRMRRMGQSLAKDDRAAFCAEAHALKGSAGMIGAHRLAEIAAAAERADATVSTEYLGKRVHEMHRACDEIRLMLETLFPI